MQVTQIPIDCNLQETTHHVTEGIPLSNLLNLSRKKCPRLRRMAMA